MPLKIAGTDLTGMKYNGNPLTAAKFNGVALWPTMPAPTGNLYGRMKALTSRETITHFKTAIDVGGFLKYRVYPTKYTEGVIGELIAEAAPLLVAGDGVDRVPLVRGFEVISSSQIRLRQAGGDNTTYTGGVNTGTIALTWANYISANHSANDAIYVIDVTSSIWLMLNPRRTNGGTFGTSFWNWKAIHASNLIGIKSSFDVPGATGSLAEQAKLAKIQAWFGEIKADTKKREFVIMISNDKTIVPVF